MRAGLAVGCGYHLGTFLGVFGNSLLDGLGDGVGAGQDRDVAVVGTSAK